MDQIIEIEQVKAKAITFPEQAKAIIVRDYRSLGLANQFFLDIRALRKEISSYFDPIIEKAKEAKKKADQARAEAVSQKERAEAPLVIAEAYLNGQITNYKREQDRIREEEEERNRQEAIKVEMERRKKEEDQRLKEAAKLEKAGAKEEAEALIQETIQAQEEPMQIYVASPSTPKVELEGMAMKTYWSANVTNKIKLIKAVSEGRAPTNCLDPNMTVLNGLARSLKKEMKIDGVEAISSSSMAATGRKL